MCHIFTLLNSYRHTTLICVTFSPRATLRIYSLHWLHWLVRDSILGKFLFDKKRAWKLSRLQRFLTKSIESVKPSFAFVAVKMIPLCVGLDVGAILLDPPEDVPTLIFLFVGGGLQQEIGDQRHLAFAKFSPVTLRRLPPCPICKPGLLFCRLNDPEPLLSSVCQAHPELLFLQAPRVFLHLVHEGLVLEGRVDLHQVAAQAPAVVSCLKPTHCLVLEPVRKAPCQS